MASNTIDDVQNVLDQSLAWRRIEMHTLTSAMASAQRRSPNSPLSRVLARSSVALLYAHWEGFVKEACQTYVDFVTKRRLRLGELNDGFLRTALMALGKRAIGGDVDGTEALLDAIRRPNEARARFPKQSMVDTKSNLRYSVLREIFLTIGFTTEKFDTKSKLIDRSLCDVRNTVAHGRELFPDPSDVESLHLEVLEMMEAMRDLILASLREKRYRRTLSS